MNPDLNLLIALDALLQERSVTRAASRMRLSQPALSSSLARLRRHFGDELLTRVGNDYRLTPLAIQLKEQSRVALSAVERVFSAQPEFDPASSVREFVVLASDYLITVLGDRITRLFTAEAPNARLRFGANTPERVDRTGQALLGADLVVLPHGFLSDLSHRDLYRDEWVCLIDAGNTGVGDVLTVEHLESLPWVVTFHTPTASTLAGRQMRTLGIEPRIQVVTESFLTVPGLIAGSNRIALLQRRLVESIPADGLRVLDPPFAATPVVEAMWWYPIYDRDPGHRYLRDLLIRAAEDIDAVNDTARQ